MRKFSKAALIGATSVALAGAFTATGDASSNRPVLDRTAKGAIDKPNGAQRVQGDQTQIIRSSIKSGKIKNVILVIGDGMGDSEITVARNYLRGAGGAFPGIDALPITGNMTTYSVNKQTGAPDYTSESASTATAWATGTKTYDGAIGVDRFEKPRKSLLQLAKKQGLATGNVTTSEIQDATPAAEVAHVTSRSCYGPTATTATCPTNAKQNGGLGSISEQLLDTRPDVTIGGGSKTFAEKATAGKWKDLTLAQQAKRRGFNYVTDTDALLGVRSADQDRPLLALVSSGNMPVKFASSAATVGGANGGAIRCAANPDFNQVPNMRQMTRKSIDLLSKSKTGKKKGFFLQIESASIDKRNHAADPCGQIGETGQLDDAVKQALDFARNDGRTLVLVTADHAHTSQIVDGNTPGLSAKLRTNEGADMMVSYGTAPAGGSQQHTGSQVRIGAFGPGAANVSGLIDQTDVFGIVSRGLRLR